MLNVNILKDEMLEINRLSVHCTESFKHSDVESFCL